jgi:hypothetical protein
MKSSRFILAIIAAFLWLGGQSWANTTILPPGKTCFEATVGITGMIGLLGSITGGSGYVTGSYGGVPLTGGTGSGATANITVSGGIVTVVAILNPGVQYTAGDSLSASAANLGGAGSGFSVPVSSTAINGSLAGGTVSMFQPGTTTPKATWQDSGQVTLNSQPITLDANGCAVIYGTGSYRQQLFDSLGNLVWDQVTTDTSASNSEFWAGLSGGTPNVITVVDPGFNATDGSVINFTALSTNTGPVTLNPSGFGAAPILKDTTAGPVALIGGEIVQTNPISVIYRASDASFHILNPPIQSASGSTAPLCGVTGLKIINDAGSANTTVDITADSAVMVSPTGQVINRSNVSLILNFGNTGANGIDQGALQNQTPYNFWLIDNGAAPAALGSTQAASPIMPAGYTYKCRVGATFTDNAAHLVSLTQFGRETMLSSNATSLSTSTLAGACNSSFVGASFPAMPPTAIIANVTLLMNGSSQPIGIALPTPAGASSGNLLVTIPASTALTQQYARVLMPAAQTIFWCNGSTNNAMRVTGWVDKVNSN